MEKKHISDCFLPHKDDHQQISCANYYRDTFVCYIERLRYNKKDKTHDSYIASIQWKYFFLIL